MQFSQQFCPRLYIVYRKIIIKEQTVNIPPYVYPMVGQPLQQRIFPEQSYRDTASHTVSTGESKQKRFLNCKQGNTGYIYNIKRDTGTQNISEIEAGNYGRLLSFRVYTLSSSPNSMTFHDFFHDLRFSCHFQKFSKLYLF